MKSPVTRENMAIGNIESFYFKKRRNQIHISLEDLEDTEWMWSTSEIRNLEKLWKKRMPLKDMAVELGRSEIAVFFQVLDRLYKGRIQARNWNIW